LLFSFTLFLGSLFLHFFSSLTAFLCFVAIESRFINHIETPKHLSRFSFSNFLFSLVLSFIGLNYFYFSGHHDPKPT
ncbi:unnamed protein product, partial [Brassica rapa subsp. trilocularis]